jgi:hypothetical protein
VEQKLILISRWFGLASDFNDTCTGTVFHISHSDFIVQRRAAKRICLEAFYGMPNGKVLRMLFIPTARHGSR